MEGERLKTLTVTWMDDRQETYTIQDLNIANDTLHVTDTGSLRDTYHFPLVNIRVYKVERMR